MEALFNRQLKRGRCVAENAFGILKQTFRELLLKSHLNVAFLLDLITACAILHNILLRQSHKEVEQLPQILRTKGLDGEVLDDNTKPQEAGEIIRDVATTLGTEIRTQLGVFLTTQRHNAQ